MSQTAKLALNKPATGDLGWANAFNSNFDTLDAGVVAAASAPTTGSMVNSQVKAYVNEGTAKLQFYVKYSDGTLRKGDLTLVAAP